MTKRFKFQCWNCPKVYSQSLEITDQQEKIIVSCPYCRAEAVVDLRPYGNNNMETVLRKIKTVSRGENNDKQDDDGIQLPDVFPTEKPG